MKSLIFFILLSLPLSSFAKGCHVAPMLSQDASTVIVELRSIFDPDELNTFKTYFPKLKLPKDVSCERLAKELEGVKANIEGIEFPLEIKIIN